MGPHFLDLLKNLEIDPESEIERLTDLFSEEIFDLDSMGNISLYKRIDQAAFRQLPFRETFTSLADMCYAAGIGLHQRDCTLNGLFLYAEFLLNVLSAEPTRRCLEGHSLLQQNADSIINNIKTIADRTGYAIHETGPGDYIIVQQNRRRPWRWRPWRTTPRPWRCWNTGISASRATWMRSKSY